MSAEDAERVAAFLLDAARRKMPARWRQGARVPALPSAGSPAVHMLATTRVWKVERAVAEGVAAWSRGERRVVVLDHVPSPLDVLALQARGARCVTLLPDERVPAPHEDGFAFALHDLCHLENFVDPEHHAAQVGFFATVHAAWVAGHHAELVARYDEAFARDLEHVACDMNGCSIFLFAALKMKVKMAVRRALARSRGVPPPSGGALSPDEESAFGEALGDLLDRLGLAGAPRDAALRVTTRRDHEDEARVLDAWFTAEGERVLAVSA